MEPVGGFKAKRIEKLVIRIIKTRSEIPELLGKPSKAFFKEAMAYKGAIMNGNAYAGDAQEDYAADGGAGHENS